MLAANAGPPFLLLAATGPLLQAWYARVFRGRSPYGLYAVSNLGSLLALVSYPFVVEPRMPLSLESRVATVGPIGTTAYSVTPLVFAVNFGQAPISIHDAGEGQGQSHPRCRQGTHQAGSAPQGFGKENGYRYIFDSRQPSLIFSDDSLNVTEAVLKKFEEGR
jgi:hypothetical protein